MGIRFQNPRLIICLLFFSGTIFLLASTLYSASVLAFIGLGFVFWGAILLFIRPGRLIIDEVFVSATLPSLLMIRRLLNRLDYRGCAIYLPPVYLKGPRDETMFIPSKGEIIIPSIEKVAEGEIFLKDPEGICLIPPGLDLANLFEEKLGTDFIKVDFYFLQSNLPRLFIEELEIVEDLEIDKEGDEILAKMVNSICKEFHKGEMESSDMNGFIFCPLCSAIACALAKAIGKPIVMEKVDYIEGGRTVQAHYRILGMQEDVTTPAESAHEKHTL